MAVRAIRGAIQIDADDRSNLLQATAELLTKVMHANSLESADLIS
ncbi:MAG: chorismate mutase, partial [Aquiluna sp.]